MFCNDPLKDCQPGQMCAFAQRVPEIKTATDQKVNNDRIRDRTAIVSLLDFSLRHPEGAEKMGQCAVEPCWRYSFQLDAAA